MTAVWVRLDDQVATHPKTLAAGNEAFGAWVRLLALSCAQLTDGFIAEPVGLAVTSRRVIQRLVSVRFLDLAEGGWMIHDFDHWNPPASLVRAKREADRLRKAAGRANQGRSSNGRISGASSEWSPAIVRADVQPDSARRPPVPSPSPSPSPLSPAPAPGRASRLPPPPNQKSTKPHPQVLAATCRATQGPAPGSEAQAPAHDALGRSEQPEPDPPPAPRMVGGVL